MWIYGQTGPDIASLLSQLISRASKATVADVFAINKVCRDVLHRGSIVKFPDLSEIQSWNIVVYTDSSLGNLSDGGTQGGYVVFLQNERTRKSALLSWQSQKLRRVVRSTVSAECMACIDGVDSAYLIQQVLYEIYSKTVPITVLVDKKSLVESVFTTKTITDKRLRVDLAYLRSFLNTKNVQNLSWVPSEYQLADCLTKNSKIAVEVLLKSVSTNQLAAL